MFQGPPPHPLLAGLQLLRDEGERSLSHLTPSVVNGQGVPAIRHFVELGDFGVVLLQLVLSFDDRQGDRMILLARDEQERTTLGVSGVDPVFRPGVEVGGSGSTPRNPAASMATVTAAKPSSANICAMRPPKECPTTAGFLLSWRIVSA